MINAINLNDPNIRPLLLKKSDTFFTRLRGLMFSSKIDEFEGLLFINSHENILDAAIHMLFMNFDITVLWLNREYVIVDKVVAKKGELYKAPSQKAKYIIETHQNRFSEYNIGDRIKLQDA